MLGLIILLTGDQNQPRYSSVTLVHQVVLTVRPLKNTVNGDFLTFISFLGFREACAYLFRLDINSACSLIGPSIALLVPRAG